MTIFVKKILAILNKKEKKNFFLSLIFLTIRSSLEVLSIGSLLPILSFASDQDKIIVIYKYLPVLQKLNNKEIIFFFVLLFVFIYLIKTIFLIFYSTWNTRFVNNLSLELTQRVLDGYLSKNYVFFLENNSATLVKNISDETSLFALGLIGNIISIITHTIFIIFIFLFLVLYNIYTFYVILIISFFSTLIIYFSNKKFKKWGDIRKKESSFFFTKVHEVVGSIKEIILYNKKSFFLEEVYFHAKKFSRSNIYRDTSISFTGPIIEFTGIFVFFSFFLFLISSSLLNLGEIFVLFGIYAFASLRLLPAVIGFVRAFQALKFNLPACDTIYEILKNSKDLKNLSVIREKRITKLSSMQFENVSFAYPSKKFPVLFNLNFKINAGDKIAIIGETGSGKTTLLNLISSLIFPTNGIIRINNLDKLDLSKEVRNYLGYVSQSVYISDNSIFYNIALTNHVTKDQKINIMNILESLNLSIINNELVNENISIGERGAKLSGGQIQRIGIARALFRNPDILILDESTNALDEENESKILEFLIREFEKKIIIFCSHKKEILKYCNKVIEVKNNTAIVKQHIY